MKRLFDIVTSLFGLVLLFPVFLLLAVIIKLDSKGSCFFTQTRIGKQEKPFNIYKFRSMVLSDACGPQITVQGDNRITKVGKYLRKFKLDELPQLINVFKGDMSLVGPRPEVPQYVKIYTDEQKKVLSVRPGITDYASLYFFDEERILKESSATEQVYEKVIMQKKLSFNLEYIKKQSFMLDISLIFKTFLLILRKVKN